ncbi:N-acetylmuramoyl-L-alanine amidase [Rubrobacter calidifluminis]|uniref:N-acetylmuramoyl-L-alanine amidase n=1 Tax=Rubrobacter calidifluminis TaxID=1392640 RepID=UPI0023617009|nr:N-acetylmuramoyl-L-alanine amidase [Rubrobacter calidifluminis]
MTEQHPGGCLAHDQSGGVQRLVTPEREIREAVEAIKAEIAALEPPDYYASEYLASPNYSSRSAYGDSRIRVIVVHDMESSYQAGVSWLRNPSSQVSSHYAVGSHGENCQMVGEQYACWAVAYDNGFTVSIEHEGYASTGRYYTEEMYETSAKIAAGICHRHGIPPVRSTSHGICAHSDLGAAGGGHHDPGPYWDWERYLSLVKKYLSGGGVRPAPQKGLWRVQVGAFNQKSNADTLASRLKKAGFDTYVVKSGFWRVQCGAFSERKNAEELAAHLKKAGFEAFVRRS